MKYLNRLGAKDFGDMALLAGLGVLVVVVLGYMGGLV